MSRPRHTARLERSRSNAYSLNKPSGTYHDSLSRNWLEQNGPPRKSASAPQRKPYRLDPDRSSTAREQRPLEQRGIRIQLKPVYRA